MTYHCWCIQEIVTIGHVRNGGNLSHRNEKRNYCITSSSNKKKLIPFPKKAIVYPVLLLLPICKFIINQHFAYILHKQHYLITTTDTSNYIPSDIPLMLRNIITSIHIQYSKNSKSCQVQWHQMNSRLGRNVLQFKIEICVFAITITHTIYWLWGADSI